jgi:hypothetical protein
MPVRRNGTLDARWAFVIDANRLPLVPPNQPLLHLGYGLPAAAVSMTIVDGRVVCDRSGLVVSRVIPDRAHPRAPVASEPRSDVRVGVGVGVLTG